MEEALFDVGRFVVDGQEDCDPAVLVQVTRRYLDNRVDSDKSVPTVSQRISRWSGILYTGLPWPPQIQL